MNNSGQFNTTIIQRAMVLVAAVCVAGLFAVQAFSGDSAIFNLRFNPYALLSLAGVIGSGVMLYQARRVSLRSDEAMWFLLLTATLALFATAELFQRLSATPQAAIFWAGLQGIGVGFEAVAYFMFFLSYVSSRRRQIATAVFMLLSAAVIAYFHAASGIVFNDDPAAIKLYPWGYNNQPGDGFIFNALWVFVLAFGSYVLLFKYRRHVKNNLLKQQANLFLVAFAIPIAAALATDVAGPALGLPLPPVYALSGLVMVALLLRGFKQYSIFKVSPTTFSQDVLALMNEAVVVTDAKYKIELLNKTAQNMLGVSEADETDHHLLDYFDKPTAEALNMALTEAGQDTTKATMDNIRLGPADNPQYVKLTAVKTKAEQGINGYIIVFSDVTALKRAYNELEFEKNNIEQIVDERTSQLRDAQTKLQRTDELKTEFVMLTSHNLRTPLAILEGNLDLFSSNAQAGADDASLASMRASTERLRSFVEELLTISSIEAGSAGARATVEVQSIISPLIADGEQFAANTGNRFEHQADTGDAKISVDTSRLTAALRNILDNAFKYTSQGTVSLSASVDEGQLLIEVKDTGRGMSASEQSELFTKFHRGTDATRSDTESKGLGLYLSKLVIDDNGGTIKVTSQEGAGTAMTVSLPLSYNLPITASATQLS